MVHAQQSSAARQREERRTRRENGSSEGEEFLHDISTVTGLAKKVSQKKPGNGKGKGSAKKKKKRKGNEGSKGDTADDDDDGADHDGADHDGADHDGAEGGRDPQQSEDQEIDQRVASILSVVAEEGGLAPGDLEMSINSPQANYQHAEDRGFVILCRGFRGPSQTESGEWDDKVLKQRWAEFGTRIRTLAVEHANETPNKEVDSGNVNSTAQLHRLHQEILRLDAHQSASSLYAHLSKNLSVLDFASRWAVLSAGAGSLERQKQYYEAAYQAQPNQREVFDGQDAAICSDLMETEEHQLAYQEFRNQYRYAVTSRNRYLTLYDTFGVIVLFVKFFDGTRLRNNDTTKGYTKVLQALTTALEDVLDQQDERNWEVRWMVALYQRICHFDDQHRV
ncbi:hypothetical protein B0H14DRAFT_2666188 [Mycena olivaceomarginata]|nr:hypothetical protein B0H14DRAFT_2666188 [Mycena olivaceomarginata]